MMLRGIEKSDLDWARAIHESGFKQEFPFPEFESFLACFVGENADGLVSLMGLKQNVELVSLSDLSRNVRERREAMIKLFDCCAFVARNNGYNQIQASAHDGKWLHALLKKKFSISSGTNLFYNL